MAVLLLSAIAYVGVGYAVARVLTGRARATFAEPAPDGYRDVRPRTSDGLRIGGWWRAPEAPRATVVLAHGNGASRRQQLDQANAFLELGERVDTYVLVGAYTDLRVAVRRRTRRYLPPGIELLAYGALLTGGRLALPELDRIRPVEAATRVPERARVLLVAGGADDRAPPSDSEAIAANLAHARVVIAEGLDHEDLRELPRRPEWDEVTAMIP